MTEEQRIQKRELHRQKVLEMANRKAVISPRRVVKEIRGAYTEKTPYGPHEVNYLKRFEHHEHDGFTYQTETTFQNGICTFSAQYPAFTEYANQRMGA